MIQSEVVPSAAGEVLIGAVLVLASVALAPLCVALAQRLFPGRNVFFARWRFAHVGIVILSYALLTAFAAVALGLLGGEDGPSALMQVLVTVGIQLGVAVVIWRFAEHLDPAGWRSLGLRKDGTARAALVGVCAYVLAFPGVIGLGLLWSALLSSFGIEPQPQAVVELALELEGPSRVLFVVLAAAVLPFFEELVFRGFLQPLLVQNLGDRGGVLVASVAFAALHGLAPFAPILGLSLVLGSVMLRTQRLGAAWLVHALHNGTMLAFLFFVPQARELLGQ